MKCRAELKAIKSIKDLKRKIKDRVWFGVGTKEDILKLIGKFEVSVKERIKETEKLELTVENASVELALGAQKAELRRILGEEVKE